MLGHFLKRMGMLGFVRWMEDSTHGKQPRFATRSVLGHSHRPSRLDGQLQEALGIRSLDPQSLPSVDHTEQRDVVPTPNARANRLRYLRR